MVKHLFCYANYFYASCVHEHEQLRGCGLGLELYIQVSDSRVGLSYEERKWKRESKVLRYFFMSREEQII